MGSMTLIAGPSSHRAGEHYVAEADHSQEKAFKDPDVPLSGLSFF
jgi:hypothetical protein